MVEFEDVVLIEPQRFVDKRGFFAELYSLRRYAGFGLDLDFVQHNHSFSLEIGTLRGLHFQCPPFAQAKLVRCGRGSIFDVVLDVRLGSPTFGKWKGFELSAANGLQLFIPVGFAHGFVTLESESEIVYMCSDYYNPSSEGCIRWDSCGIEWPLSGLPIVSEKDDDGEFFDKFVSPFVFGVNS